MSDLPFVSAVIPCRNEARFLGACLDSVLANDYPVERLEILVVDGMSEDGTRSVAEEYARRFGHVRLLENAKRIIPAAMNVGIAHARGDLIVKIDAHSVYAADYFSKCVQFQAQYDADNVGGIIVTRPREARPIARSIALCLAHPFGSGNSHFRIGSRAPRWADTAAFGCYRRDVFRRIGLYNESLVRSSDMDLNGRLRRAGGRILLVPEIVAYYYPRARLGDFFLRNIVDGFWATYPLKYGGQAMRWRHGVPLACVLAALLLLAAQPVVPALLYVVIALVAAYAALAVGVGIRVGIRERDAAIALVLPVTFAVRHAGYAIGSLGGALAALASREFWRRTGRDWRPEAPF